MRGGGEVVLPLCSSVDNPISRQRGRGCSLRGRVGGLFCHLWEKWRGGVCRHLEVEEKLDYLSRKTNLHVSNKKLIQRKEVN